MTSNAKDYGDSAQKGKPEQNSNWKSIGELAARLVGKAVDK
jgi:hypothetical protein